MFPTSNGDGRCRPPWPPGIRAFFCRPESFTPDLAATVRGRARGRELPGGGPGLDRHPHRRQVGRALAPRTGSWPGSPTSTPPAWTSRGCSRSDPPSYRRDQIVESLGLVYACPSPNRDKGDGAPEPRRSPVHAQLAAAGARFRDVSGWEGADWYGAVDDDPLTWARPAWFGHWAAEHRAVREAVGLMDMSFMAKLLVQGQDGLRAVLDHLSVGDVDGEQAGVTYAQWLNGSGRLEADLTVTKLDAERYWVVASDTAHRHVETMIRRALGTGAFADARATVTDVSSGWAQLNVQGPRSRELLASLTSADLSNEAFPFRTAATIDLGYAQVLCLRITYLGELGYELYVPAEHAVEVYDRIVAAGTGFGLKHAGLKALSSLRMEKAYRDYGHDIDNTDTVVEVGLGFAVALTRADGSARDFVGRAAVEAQKAAGVPSSRLVQVLVNDPEPLLQHGEVLRRDGVEVGYLRAASYGHTLGGAVGLAMVSTLSGEPATKDWLDGGSWDVDIVDRRYPVTVSLRPSTTHLGQGVRG